MRANESSLGGLRVELCGGAELIDGLVEAAEGIAERMGEVVGRIDEAAAPGRGMRRWTLE